MNRKKQVISASMSLLLSVGMSAGSILPVFATEEETEAPTTVNVQTDESATKAKAPKISTQSEPGSGVAKQDAEEGEGSDSEGEEQGVAIDEKNFPDEAFRSYVKKRYDWDKNGYLSDGEIERVTELSIGGDDEDGLNSCKNFQGVELFPNLDNISVRDSDMETMDTNILSIAKTLEIRECDNIKNLDLSACTKLENLTLEGCGNITNLDLSPCSELGSLEIEYCNKLEKVNARGCKNLRSSSMENCDKLNTVDLSECKELTTVAFDSTEGFENINVSGCENLTTIDSYGCKGIKTLDLSRCGKLETLNLYNSGISALDLSPCKESLQALNVSDCKNLKDVDITGCKSLEEVNFSDCNNLKEVDVEQIKKQFPKLRRLGLNSSSKKEVDLTGLENLTSFNLDEGDVESIKFDKKSRFVGIDIEHNEIKELDLDGIMVTDMEDDSPEVWIARQTPTITITAGKVKNNTIALSDLFSDVSRVTIKKGSKYTYDDSAKTITFKSAKNMKFNYLWDTKYGGYTLDGTANVVVEDTPTTPDKPAVKTETITKMNLAATKYTYDGKNKTPAVSVYAGNTKLDASKYTVTYPTSRKNIGTYTVKVVGNKDKGCEGTISATFQVVPKTVKTPTAKAGKKQLAIKWVKVSGGVKYQVAIAKKGGKYKTYALSGTSKTVKKLTSKKNYVVKVRAYKKVGSKTYYGNWSKTKTVKVK